MFFKNLNLVICQSCKFSFFKSISIVFLNFFDVSIKNLLLNFKFCHTFSTIKNIFNISTVINISLINDSQFSHVQNNFEVRSFIFNQCHELNFIFRFKFNNLIISLLIQHSLDSFHVKISVFNDSMCTINLTINFFIQTYTRSCFCINCCFTKNSKQN
ncbi:hypothetical protein D3C71_1395100 [compost metagenome]